MILAYLRIENKLVDTAVLLMKSLLFGVISGSQIFFCLHVIFLSVKFGESACPLGGTGAWLWAYESCACWTHASVALGASALTGSLTSV